MFRKVYFYIIWFLIIFPLFLLILSCVLWAKPDLSQSLEICFYNSCTDNQVWQARSNDPAIEDLKTINELRIVINKGCGLDQHEMPIAKLELVQLARKCRGDVIQIKHGETIYFNLDHKPIVVLNDLHQEPYSTLFGKIAAVYSKHINFYFVSISEPVSRIHHKLPRIEILPRLFGIRLSYDGDTALRKLAFLFHVAFSDGQHDQVFFMLSIISLTLLAYFFKGTCTSFKLQQWCYIFVITVLLFLAITCELFLTNPAFGYVSPFWKVFIVILWLLPIDLLLFMHQNPYVFIALYATYCCMLGWCLGRSSMKLRRPDFYFLAKFLKFCMPLEDRRRRQNIEPHRNNESRPNIAQHHAIEPLWNIESQNIIYREQQIIELRRHRVEIRHRSFQLLSRRTLALLERSEIELSSNEDQHARASKAVQTVKRLQERPDYDCSICLTVLDVGDPVCKFSCQHTFHGECIKTWVLEHRQSHCPLCRKPLQSEQM